MAVGFPLKTTYANGDVYSALDVNDTNGTINLLTSSTLSVAAGKNPIINGGFDVWQRGTSLSFPASTYGYTADRWATSTNASQACTISRQLTNDTTNLPNIQYCVRLQRNSGQTGTGTLFYIQALETVNSIPFAGKTVTFSFYARRGANYSATSNILAVAIGTGTGTDQTPFSAWTNAASPISQNATLTTTWQRFTYSATLASNITQIKPSFTFDPTGTAGANDYFEVTGIQLELGSVATSFSRAGGTIQGELAACQRYYYRLQPTATVQQFGFGWAFSTTGAVHLIDFPVTMRTNPTALEQSGTAGDYTVAFAATAVGCSAVPSFNNATVKSAVVTSTVASGFTVGQGNNLRSSATAAYLGWSAEL
jgi:hypothetical protein